MKRIRIFAPATVANVSCGFDAMGFALETLGDEMIFTKNDSGIVTISRIEGAVLPYDSGKNAAGVVANKMLEDSKATFGVDIEIFKKYKPGSGLGSSAASSAGAAFAMNYLLDNRYSQVEQIKFSMLGEEVACGVRIADNVSASLYGGFVLVRSYEPLEIVSIPTPSDLFVTILHPQIELKTAEGRAILPTTVSLKNAITQWANVGGLISGLHTQDYALIGRSVHDVIIEPVRKKMIPHFDEVKQAVLNCGGLAAGISGSGPSIFALSKGIAQAKIVEHTVDTLYKNKGINYYTHVSKIANKGVYILEENEIL